MAQIAPESFDISRVTVESLSQDISEGYLDLPNDIATQLPTLVQNGITDFYIAKLPPPNQGPIGQVCIRWDSPLLDETKVALGAYLHQEPESVNIPNVSFVYVGDRFRRMHLGSMLLETVHTAALRRGYSHTYLDVSVNNPVARRTFMENGYLPTGYVRTIESKVHRHDFQHRTRKLGAALMIHALT